MPSIQSVYHLWLVHLQVCTESVLAHFPTPDCYEADRYTQSKLKHWLGAKCNHVTYLKDHIKSSSPTLAPPENLYSRCYFLLCYRKLLCQVPFIKLNTPYLPRQRKWGYIVGHMHLCRKPVDAQFPVCSRWLTLLIRRELVPFSLTVVPAKPPRPSCI